MDYLIQIPRIPGQNRFDAARFIGYRSDTFDPLNSYLIQAIGTLPVTGVYTVQDDVNRPDMICAAIYQDDMQYWWLLMIYNELWDFGAPPFPMIPSGTKVNYFSVAALERLYFTLRSTMLLNGVRA